jgi:hypothetical protein
MYIDDEGDQITFQNDKEINHKFNNQILRGYGYNADYILRCQKKLCRIKNYLNWRWGWRQGKEGESELTFTELPALYELK